jgi:polygalacturonase
MATISLLDFGGKSGAEADNTQAFARAFEQLRGHEGGALSLGAGLWRSGPIELFSNIKFLLEKGAVLQFIPDAARYTPVKTRWQGVDCYAMHPCLFAQKQINITVGGSGVIDGSGEWWWNETQRRGGSGQWQASTSSAQRDGEQFLRPPLVQFLDCETVRLRGLTVQNSPFWTVHPLLCRGVTVSGIHIENPADTPNTDGIDVESCENVTIENCVINVGDDGIAIKAGSDPASPTLRPASHIRISECTVGAAHGGVVIGSETSGGVTNVLAEKCTFINTDRGIRLKSRRGRGGKVHGLEFRDIAMERPLCPFAVNMFYKCGAEDRPELFSLESRPVSDDTPAIFDIALRNITAANCRASAGFVAGLPESPVRGLSLENCGFSVDPADPASPDDSEMFLGLPPGKDKAFRIINAENPAITGCAVSGTDIPFVYK